VAGHWRANGRYIARESASQEPEKSGFGAEAIGIDIAAELRNWQDGADRRLWKLIISPEFGERLDLQRLTRDVMSRIESDLHTSLDWGGVALQHGTSTRPRCAERPRHQRRGVQAGSELRQERPSISRATFRNCATRPSNGAGCHTRTWPAGFAAALHATGSVDYCARAAGGRRLRHLSGGGDPTRPGLGRFAAVREQSLAARLVTLETMGSPDGRGRTGGRFGAIWRRL
jgi:hypothetical protein